MHDSDLEAADLGVAEDPGQRLARRRQGACSRLSPACSNSSLATIRAVRRPSMTAPSCVAGQEQGDQPVVLGRGGAGQLEHVAVDLDPDAPRSLVAAVQPGPHRGDHGGQPAGAHQGHGQGAHGGRVDAPRARGSGLRRAADRTSASVELAQLVAQQPAQLVEAGLVGSALGQGQVNCGLHRPASRLVFPAPTDATAADPACRGAASRTSNRCSVVFVHRWKPPQDPPSTGRPIGPGRLSVPTPSV